ncbi:cytochrome c biogenesis protein/redoxin [Schlegelella sp. S2-27]|uniref:Cytochrome c biogenesis protein/redoxin n=1 Tax=Caldimonas mangrovi TaxID=2944811 RepID=A0ABT0YRQ5_9BURK|nr:cytochrome c biogenesis protein/redoxin [Caldimonas mangrovi]MCM5681425.1 cytochrome c biogenesis protein/redoxin [Caldimonas mangrovi]
MLNWTLAAAAGAATVASPCVLPMLPLLLGATVGEHDRRRPLYIVIGFVLSFVLVASAFGAAAQVFGVSHDAVRQAGAGLLVAAGALMLWPRATERVALWLGPVAAWGHRLAPPGQGRGAAAALVLGASLGAVWTPCAGPVLASILALVATADTPAAAAPLLAAYALGAALPMLAIAYGGQAATTMLRPVLRHAELIRRVFGVMVMAVGVAMLGRWDVQAIAWATQWAAAPYVGAPDEADRTPAAAGEPAPEFAGIDHWLNSAPLTMAQLHGKVVLVDFWTHGCVNCIRTVPHVERWHRMYANQGLVVVGVHTPEFGYERPLEALQGAVRRYGLTYPIAQDNSYRTWSAYRNRYWPAHYLIDREGRIVYRHFGEGGERETERRIRELLAPRDAGQNGRPG